MRFPKLPAWRPPSAFGVIWALSLLTTAAQAAPWVHEVRDAGVTLRVQLGSGQSKSASDAPVLRAGASLDFELKVQDEGSAQALRGARPRAWMTRLTADRSESCIDHVRRFASGRFTAKADRDLNTWQLLSLNGDGTLSIINPQVHVASTRLESLLTLPGPGAEMVHLAASDRLLITIPSTGHLVVVDLQNFKVVHRVSLGKGQPRKLLASPDERTAYVALDEGSQLVAVDVQRGTVQSRVEIGAGLHGLAITDDGQRLVATASKEGLVSVVRTSDMAVLAKHSVGQTPLAVAWSRLSGRAYVARVNGDTLAVLDTDTGARLTDAPWAPRTTALRADPSGRWLMGVSGRDHVAWVLDASSGRRLGSIRTVDEPDQVVYTSRFAYVRGLQSVAMSLIDLDLLAQGRLAATEVPVFQRAPSQAAAEIGSGDMMVPLPEGTGMLVANGADTAIYSYQEGMQAPEGSFRTYSRATRAVAVVDRSLQETQPGVFKTRIQFDQGGRYVLAMLIDRPRVVQCAELRVDDTGVTPTGLRLGLRFLDPQGQTLSQVQASAGQVIPLRLQLVDADDPEKKPLVGLKDVQLMALELPGISQSRQFMREVEPGVYAAEQRFLRAGRWRMMVQVSSKGLSFERGAHLDVTVNEAAAAEKKER